ncbi:response regulator [Alicyclobacillus acidocaldarius]|uniref:Response regulator receiver protein n=1 Tax=Alicyclobacillus acidocaldarius subsp. acidocaldarius (strain ATCC 27009 / DSM 446 / BCRC 14685 / JCM 5260 / KCTC 1825 / NBRC 15652 / NCIMB 11725 / NRRL B-14509 / 104-IA) TaxID=521098 RepID=C8WUH2_ALIAD|nr:response regulator [Alicyclobacillus acidocaldarius]ACV59788.1 response regulator receiver protein [Alicyclobacillus acidocaldarius subsp. acidocaldarius DSM 446]
MAYKVLVVDDQFGIRVLLHEVLQREGYEVFQASNGPSALSIVEREQPDLVLLDMKIPGMDGLEILRNLRKLGVDAKVIMMTAYGELDLIHEAMEMGAVAHFTKPFDIDELRRTVREHLEARAQAE